MSSIIVCGDIHGKVPVVEMMLEDPNQIVIFVGDYLDSYNRTHNDQIEVIEQVMDACETRDNVVALMGNHELSYLYSDYRCSGWSPIIQLYVDENRERIEDNLVLFAVANDYLITHAGVSLEFLPEGTDLDLESIMEYLDTMPSDRIHEVSRLRGGIDPVGGPFWCDWTEFKPIPGIKQIMGHSGHRGNKDRGILSIDENYNIDCLDHARQVLEITKTGAMFKDI